MKNINQCEPAKYQGPKYEKVEEHIYKITDPLLNQSSYVTSLTFEQEPDLGEGDSSSNISQNTLEDILDKFFISVEDFYEEENSEDTAICYVEFLETDITDMKALLTLVGKHVYNKEVERVGNTYIELAIE